MKRILFLLMAVLVVCVLAAPAHAFLINRGTDTLGNRLIYDTDLDITWYDYSAMNTPWFNSVAWVDGLSVVFGSATYNDWRLPSTVDGSYVYGYDGTTTAGYNITTGEMGHLFYTELGNLGQFDTSGILQPGWGVTNTGVFQNLAISGYWSGTEYADGTNYAWFFNFYYGEQYLVDKGTGGPGFYAMVSRIHSLSGYIEGLD